MDYEKTDDEKLAALARLGDGAAEAALAERYAGFVESLTRPYFLVGAERDDLVQMGMIGLLSAIRSFSPDKCAAFKTYASHCVRNALTDAVRSAGARKNSPLNLSLPLDDPDAPALGLPSVAPSAEQEYIAKESEKAFFDALSTLLDETDLNIIKLYLASMPYKEISAELGVTAKKVDNTIYSVKKKLEKLLKR